MKKKDTIKQAYQFLIPETDIMGKRAHVCTIETTLPKKFAGAKTDQYTFKCYQGMLTII